MSVYPPGFSERVFEFGFNSEYAAQNRAVLAAAPHIPTQNEEKALGYDIAFEIKRRGGVVRSVALQHKTCRFVDRESATNQHFWNAIGGAYFAFRVNVDQFNLIETIASSGLPGVLFVYCAPLFSMRKDMDTHYLATSVLTQTVWINPKGAGAIFDSEPHSIVFDPMGTKAFLFSNEPRVLTATRPRRRPPKASQPDAEPVRLGAVYETIYSTVSNFRSRAPRRSHDGEPAFYMPRELPRFIRSRDEGALIRALGELLSDYVGVSWLVEVKR